MSAGDIVAIIMGVITIGSILLAVGSYRKDIQNNRSDIAELKKKKDEEHQAILNNVKSEIKDLKDSNEKDHLEIKNILSNGHGFLQRIESLEVNCAAQHGKKKVEA